MLIYGIHRQILISAVSLRRNIQQYVFTAGRIHPPYLPADTYSSVFTAGYVFLRIYSQVSYVFLLIPPHCYVRGNLHTADIKIC